MFLYRLSKSLKIIIVLNLACLLYSSPIIVNGLTTNATTPVALPTRGLVANLTFDGKKLTTTTATDSSGQGNDGTLVNGPRPAAGKVGQALYFDGVDDYVSFGGSNVLAPDAGFTVSAWIKHATTTVDSYGTVRLKGASSEFLLGHGKTGNGGIQGTAIYFGFRGNTAMTSSDSRYYTNTSYGKWNHYLIMYNGVTKGSTGSWRLFVNGIELPISAGGTIGGPTNVSEIGRDGGAGTPSQSYIDDVRVYDRQLSLSEISAIAGVQAKAQVTSAVGPNNGLTAWWTFDGNDMTGTTVVDKSGNGNTGTSAGSPSNILGKVGQAINLNGSQYVDFGNPTGLNFTGDMTTSFWVKPSSLPGSYTVLLNKHSSGSAGFVIQQISGDMMFAWGNGATYTCDTLPANKVGTLTLGAWQHVVVVKSGAAVTGYINGVQTGSCTGAFSGISTNGDSVLLGRWSSSNSRYFSGAFDDVRMYGRAISIAEVQNLYKIGQSAGTYGVTDLSNVPVSNGLALYFPFDGKTMSGTIVTDVSGNGNTGTLVDIGLATSTAVGKIGQALYFNPLTTDSVTFGSNVFVSSVPFSVSVWAKSASTTLDNMGILRLKGSASEFMFDTGKTGNANIGGTSIYFGFRGNAGITTNDSRFYTDTTYGKWHHYVITFNGGAKSTPSNWGLYVDGEAISLGTTGTIGSAFNANVIGIDPSSGYMHGSLDDLRVYNRQISQKEAMILYKMGAN